MRPAEMVLVDGGAVAQAVLALKNVAQVLSAGPRDGEGMSAAGALALTMYITRTEDAVAVRAAALNWLRKVTDQPKASSEQHYNDQLNRSEQYDNHWYQAPLISARVL